jgi:SNF2 family DNA or RNA helicase
MASTNKKFFVRQGQMSKLEFSNGHFNLTTDLKIKSDGFWIKVDKGVYSTKSLKAAAEFRRFSSETCEKIFKRTFNVKYSDPILPPLPHLDPHQLEGVTWILSRKRCYLAHAPGAGKTCQAITAALLCTLNAKGQVLLIVPPSLVANWQREIEMWGTELGRYPTIGFVRTSKEKAFVDWHSDILIIPDSMLWTDWVYMKLQDIKRNLRFIAVDEASRLKEQNSKRSIAFYGGYFEKRYYAGIFQHARHVVFLDGSPMPNRATELWAPTYALDPSAIDCLEFDDFGYRYGGAVLNPRGVWEYKGTSRERELKEKLQKDFMHVVTEDKLNHPERLRSILVMNEDVRSSDQKSWEAKHLPKLKEIDDEVSVGEMAHFRLELGLRKTSFIYSYVADRLREKNESILLFVWHREVAQILDTKLQNFKPRLVIGGTPDAQREKAFSDFQEGKAKLIIGNIQAMGRGHNLQRADRIIFGEFSWTDETNKQCEKRASRRGRDSQKAVRCEYICCPNSIDEKVLRSVFTKEKRVRKVIG